MGPRALVLALLPTAVAANKGVTVTQIVGGSAAVLWDIKYKNPYTTSGTPCGSRVSVVNLLGARANVLDGFLNPSAFLNFHLRVPHLTS